MPFSVSHFVRSQWGSGPHSKLLQQWRMGKKLEILKGNFKSVMQVQSSCFAY